MALRNSKRPSLALLVSLAAAPVAAQVAAPLRLSFAEAVSRAAGSAPAVELAMPLGGITLSLFAPSEVVVGFPVFMA